MSDEVLDVVNERGEIIGSALRSEVHGNSSLLHRVVHVVVINAYGDILLQKRSLSKDVAAGKWDTSVGGHVDHGEAVEDAAIREMEEELGIKKSNILFLYSYKHSNDYESELVHTYRCYSEGPFRVNKEEIDEVRFWPVEEIRRNLGEGLFSDNFEEEFQILIGLK